MFSINEYDEFLNLTIKKLNGKKYGGRYNNIINSIKEFDKTFIKYNNKEISYSSIMYQVKYLKSLYNEELKEAILNYQEIIFPDFTGKNEINSIINSPLNLKIWFLRYLCLKIINCNLIEIVKNDLMESSITNKYHELDTILFKSALKSKVISK